MSFRGGVDEHQPFPAFFVGVFPCIVEAFSGEESKGVNSCHGGVDELPPFPACACRWGFHGVVQAFAEVESKGVLSAEALMNVRPFLHHMGNDPFEALSRLEILVLRIPAVKSVMELPGSGRRRCVPVLLLVLVLVLLSHLFWTPASM